MRDDGTRFPPREEHEHAFTWSECHAQVEEGARVHRFGIVGVGEDERFRVYYRRVTWRDGWWLHQDMTRARSLELMEALKSISLPLYFQAEQRTTMRRNNSLQIPRPGASLEVWWDSGGNPLVAACIPCSLSWTRSARR